MTTVARAYTIEIHSSDGALVTILENASKIPYTEAVNEAPLLKFDLPADDSKVANITKANEIWLRDYDTGTLINRFRLTLKGDKRGKTLVTSVSAEGLINQLADELVSDYTADNLTVTQIVTALLALQVLTPAITVGTIDPVVSRSISVSGDTILRAIRRLRDTVDGYLYVDENRALQWRTSIGEDKGQQIRYQKNLKGITREIDYTTLTNRLYAYGVGEGDARIKLSDVEGQDEDYIEDVDSQTEWEGIYPKAIVDKSITHPDTLMAWAVLKLAELKDPRITYRIDTIDLSESIDLDFSFEKLQLGSTITVIDEELGIDVSARVLKITHTDLLHPELMRIEVANRTKDITGSLAGVYDAQQLAQHIATRIGAGQVTVLGAFTVKDWVTDGETTIDGDNIETGTIVADRIVSVTYAQITNVDVETADIHDLAVTNAKITSLTFSKITGGTVTAKTLILSGAAAILKSSNYSAGSAGWQIKGDGNAEFNNVTVRGNIQAGVGSVISWGYIPEGDGRPDNNADVTADHGQLYGWITGAKPPTNADNTAGSPQSYGWITGSKPPIDAEANPSYVHSTYISATSIYSPTIYGGTVYIGYTLTVNGAISAAGGKVVLSASGIAIKDEYCKFYEGGNLRGTVKGWSGALSIDSAAGCALHLVGATDLELCTVGAGNIVVYDTTRPYTTGIDLGRNDKYFRKLYVSDIDVGMNGQIVGPAGAGSRHGTATYYPEQTHSDEWVLHCNIPSFSHLDDIALLRSIQEKDGRLDTETFPDMICVPPNMDVENAVINARCKGKSKTEQNAIRKEAQAKLARKAISMGSLWALNMGAILQLADRFDELKTRVAALN